jgi:hypothetical protein
MQNAKEKTAQVYIKNNSNHGAKEGLTHPPAMP